MGTGFLLMIAACVVMYAIAEADKRRGWLWFAITLCITVFLGRVTNLGNWTARLGFILAFAGMWMANVYGRSER